MTDSDAIVLPLGEKILHKSELFSARVMGLSTTPGLTKDIYRAELLLLENDPLVERTVLAMIAKQDWDSLSQGDTVLIRLYEHENGKWLSTPPLVGEK